MAGLFLWVQGDAPRIFDPEAVTVSLVHLPPPAPPAPPAPTPKPPRPPKTPKAAPKRAKRAPTKPPPRQLARTVHTPHPYVEPLRAGAAHSDDESNELTEAQLAGAVSAGEGGAGGSGGACNMVRRIQDALRRDPLVRAAVSGSSGKAIMVWNGGWVQSHGEDGKGLAAVREAIIWEIGFAPPACKAEQMHGLVVLSLNAPPTRLAVGVGEWRWSDLLTLR